MDNIFLAKLLISFLAGSIWVILTTVIADKSGPKLGGLLAGLPSIAIFILLFLAISQNPAFAVKAAITTPIIAGAESLFLVVFCFVSTKNDFLRSLTISLASWLGLAALTYLLGISDYGLSLTIFLASFLFCYVAMKKLLRFESIQAKKITYTPKAILLRGLGGGAIVAFAVLMGKIGGPILAGVFPGFPGVITSTLIIGYYAHGLEFSRNIAENALLGIIGLVIYSILVRYTYLSLGVALGTLISIMVSFSFGYLVYILQRNNCQG